MRTNRTALPFATCLLASAIAAQGALAQGGMLEEVIVTANRRAQNLQEVPMSVSAFTGDFFKDTGASSLTDLAAYTPSLKIQTSNDSRSTSITVVLRLAKAFGSRLNGPCQGFTHKCNAD